MYQNQKANLFVMAGLMFCVLFCSFCSIGCQTHVNGQTLPSGAYLGDDIYYAAHGPEFPYSREVAFQEKQKAERNEQIQQQQQMPY